MCATCSGLILRILVFGILSFPNDLLKANEPAFVPLWSVRSIRIKYVAQVAKSHLPSAETSRFLMASPMAGIKDLARIPSLSYNLISPLLEATAMNPLAVVPNELKSFLVA
ncbi:hypothetical protein WICPIJ_009363 [Wickerhamomyces pijperi]|uniref:Uncharacterized protein n=1 Tax=Wickerhamomyces pijperi TaxID=599730 RepID=A0A9P8PN20_WICPI|nr:hypothetical protein WICPIJ_009363 [Wickerhamomyces pijperi]